MYLKFSMSKSEYSLSPSHLIFFSVSRLHFTQLLRPKTLESSITPLFLSCATSNPRKKSHWLDLELDHFTSSPQQHGPKYLNVSPGPMQDARNSSPYFHFCAPSSVFHPSNLKMLFKYASDSLSLTKPSNGFSIYFE